MIGQSYRDKKVLVTGGLGFIGSNLAIRLVGLGARVTIVDSAVPECGANLHNIGPVRGELRLIPKDIADAAQFADIIGESDVIFNLAGEISHIHSMLFPERDAALNVVSQMRFLEACAAGAPGVRVVYASTRQLYGAPVFLPVNEEHPVHPVDFNGVHKYAATMYHLLLSRRGALDAVALCLTNVYGPRMALRNPCQGFLSNFLRRVVQGETLEVFGDGTQLRDPLYVDDALEAFLLAGQAPRLTSRLYNVGGPHPLSLRQIAEIARRETGGPPPLCRPFPPERKAIDIGSYYTDSTRIEAELGWRPVVPFEDGIARSIAWYRRHLSEYLDPLDPHPVCKLLPASEAPARGEAASA